MQIMSIRKKWGRGKNRPGFRRIKYVKAILTDTWSAHGRTGKPLEESCRNPDGHTIGPRGQVVKSRGCALSSLLLLLLLSVHYGRVDATRSC